MEAEGISVPTDQDSPPVGSPEIADAHLDDEVSQPSVEQRHSSQTVTLTDDLRHRIIKQVEYYFSDENLRTDQFLMNYVTKDKEGFVPISVIASFRKLKKLAPERSLIVAALKESSLLVLSSSKKKVKRLHPLPYNEVEDPQLCTVLVENLPEDHSTENIHKIFCKAGNIKNIGIRDPNVSREPKNRTIAEKLLSGKLHVLVQYETVESAEKAVVTLNDEQDWRYGMRVKLLKQRGKHGQRKTARKVSGSENNTSVQTSDPAGEEDNHVSSEHHDDTPGEELCTVLVENLPEEYSTENIHKIFCKAGNIKNICIRDPNVSREPKNCTIAEKLLSGKLHVLVEYETVESAEKAVVTLNDEQDWRYGMRVKLLKQRGKHGQRKTARKVSGSENNTSVQTSDPAGEEDNHVSSEHHDDTPGEEDGEHMAKEKNGHRGRNRGRARKQQYSGSNELGHGTGSSNHVSETSKPPGPRMPDGTRGFTMGRGRPLASQQN